MVKFKSLQVLGIAAAVVTLPSVSVAQVQPVVPISFNWDWELVIQPVPGNPLPSPIPLNLWGSTTINFFAPNPFFDLGTQDNPLPTPPSGTFTIDTEIASMNLVGTSPILGDVVLRQSANQRSLGQIQNLTNDNGNLTANSFFDIFFELEFDNPNSPGSRMTLFTESPIRAGMDFTAANRIPPHDTFWIPTWLWAEFPVNSPQLVDEFGVPWDTVIRIHAHQTVPESSTVIGAGIALGLGFLSTKRKKN